MKKEELVEDEQTANSSSHLLFKKAITTYSLQKATSLPSTLPVKRSRISSNPDGNQTGSSSSTSSTPILTAEPSNKKAKLSTSTHPEKPSKGKIRQVKRGIAPPEKYSHLKPLPDYLGTNLDIVFCGINPGQKSAQIGHHFGGPTNHFWICLHESGLTTERLKPTEDATLPERFSIGLTNLVPRPTAEQNELSRAERTSSVPDLLEKILESKPRILCFVGLGITQIIKSQLIPVCISRCLIASFLETLFFAVASTSGRVVQYQRKDKIEQFRELRNLLVKVKNGEFDSSGIPLIKK
ncbi:hypothetical protein AGABI1DRAFT_69564 [Agaricus bisporus var. burnettii JB137-S8]|uniref:Uracil-DNA glycosylase-like domain-containing protein n=1 Tax=Agaricus bisporus var. burnettii (strain JB137-S8 / ATCC MYA-4627 / FGSC 10392) TaxID=597362 RepID=K5Y5B1_AGABU|nr:uncharacterized protein AGABI1DRAFT_69564 [Agaricus bisporus var. burnettii JB137-S8]EKM83285.1 hypothetical protein AGABI1DRAFT_69564 [Agaricus bisporus var. burnettii JB137-S8]